MLSDMASVSRSRNWGPIRDSMVPMRVQAIPIRTALRSLPMYLNREPMALERLLGLSPPRVQGGPGGAARTPFSRSVIEILQL